MGYDAFGLPAENNAIKTGEPPREATERSIDSFRRQFREWGISIDWSRELGTHTPEYYRWTQWIFLQLFERGLAYRTEAPVQWCPKDATVLANEQVVDGRCERCGTAGRAAQARAVVLPDHRLRRAAARRLRPARVLARARDHDAAQLDRPLRGRRGRLPLRGARTSTSRSSRPAPTRSSAPPSSSSPPSTPSCERLVAGTPAEEAVREYVNRVARESAEERGAEDREKTGVPLGRSVVNPVNGEEIPMFVADYVLMEYGTGAIMAVPGHDTRDYEFAKAFDLPVRRVIEGVDPEAAARRRGPALPRRRADGQLRPLRRQGQPRGLRGDRRVAGRRRAAARPSVNYRLRDWLVSRQRYWGAPIPIVYCDECGIVPVPDDQLPVELPEIEDYAPQGKSPLAAAEDWVATECPRCGGPARRETDTMDTFVDSSWYFIRYLDPRNDGGRLGPRRGRPLAAGRPVHRRRRARDPAPDVRALLHQGARRHRATSTCRSRSPTSSPRG